MDKAKRYRTFPEFYPFYLSEHQNSVSRRLHFVGTTVGALLLVAAVVSLEWWIVVVALAQGYALAWIGHFYFEHNKPATFQYPLFSFMGDMRLWWETLTRRRKF